ncbi:DUF250 domain-containing protein [Paramicrosporidium saccamoebae]|uniref:DUF250 domain-containing protein n=1 Tax=Paramicrosporidium saccamoebae TaxID=1246581 RepID=A0A2H9TPW6_9FUNG|nr:DUF250 domain-containing protein [Paramicrosporidium saccamoebae]
MELFTMKVAVEEEMELLDTTTSKLAKTIEKEAPVRSAEDIKGSAVALDDSRTERIKNLLYILLNVSSAVGVVLANKLVLSVYNFQFGTLLTVLHFVVTAAALEAMAALQVFPVKHVPVMRIVPLCLSFCGFVVLTNLSLQHNTVGFYQMAKVLTTPCVALIQFSCYGMKFEPSVVTTLLVTCLGVVIATFTEVSLGMVGLGFALSAVLVTAMYQVELELNALQLLYYQAPISSAMLAICTPAFDSAHAVAQFPLTIPFMIKWLTLGMSQLCVKHEHCLSNNCHENTCQLPTKLYDSCSVAQHNCPEGLVCQSELLTCHPPGKTKQENCMGDEDCSPAMYCHKNWCLFRKTLYGMCVENKQCHDGLACYRGFCYAKCIPGSSQYGCPSGMSCQNSIRLCISNSTTSRQAPVQHFNVRKEFIVIPIVILAGLVLIVLVFVKVIVSQHGESEKKRKQLPPIMHEIRHSDSPPPYSANATPVLARIDPTTTNNGPAVAVYIPMNPQDGELGTVFPHMPFR